MHWRFENKRKILNIVHNHTINLSQSKITQNRGRTPSFTQNTD